MDKPIAIHKLSAQTGLTSRTLRHWESEGLFRSGRDEDSGWRVYDDEAVMRISVTALLRKLDIPISDIKAVMDEQSPFVLAAAIEKKLALLKSQRQENILQENRIAQFPSFLQAQSISSVTAENMPQITTFIEAVITNDEKEDFTMSELRFITLPPMRTAGNVVVGVSPEDDAMTPVIEWVDSAGLAGTARLFGGNMDPMPSGEGKPYGYGMCATVPEDATIPEYLTEMRLPGGVYAMIESTDDIPGSWRKLMKLLSENSRYTSDRSRLCLEEHIKTDKGGFFLNLMEPVKEKA